MKKSMLKNILLLLLITFICRFAQDLFDPYISFDSYMNWKLWAVEAADVVTLTIELIIGCVAYKSLTGQGQKGIRIMTGILFACCLVYTFIRQKVFLTESAVSIITIIIVAAWRAALLAAGIAILAGIAGFINRKVRKKN